MDKCIKVLEGLLGTTEVGVRMRTKAQVDGLTNADASVGELASPRETSRIRPSRGRLKQD